MSVKAKKGVSINKLRRYKLIMDIYNEHKNKHIPLTKILSEYIYPKYPISRSTLYNILFTPVEKELKEAEANRQQTLF
ncbi:hypothetical protein [Flavobacterium cerinum]|uniref:Uncharacterized protein n=1 Tax=Flavobacterium cerinum TaxID=2502784 RepID=A0A3S3RK50_9FLAO|nr:hypothetical protein [Flavobacterium cerinum]RWX00932.1 hypothetical protein EPI11_07880 [Flavobacterium cerinum]